MRWCGGAAARVFSGAVSWPAGGGFRAEAAVRGPEAVHRFVLMLANTDGCVDQPHAAPPRHLGTALRRCSTLRHPRWAAPLSPDIARASLRCGCEFGAAYRADDDARTLNE
jgi:hypothetical protein